MSQRNSSKAGEVVLTANRLSDGVAIFLGPDGEWVEDVRAARVEEGEDGHAVLEAIGAEHEANGIAIGAYLIDIAYDADGAICPTIYRERIRAQGPSTHPDFGKQAEGLASREAA